MKAPGTFAIVCLLHSFFFPSLKCASSSSRTERIRDLQNAYPNIRFGYIGFQFVDAETGETLAEDNAEKFFTPASNTKLYTNALALVRLGSEYRFTTRVESGSAWATGQTTVSGVHLIGGGDPNLSGRALPFAQDAKDGEPLSALNRLADQIADKGIRNIQGDVIGDDTRYPYDPYPDGWTLDDALWYYGTPVSALVVNDNAIHLRISATHSGALAEALLMPDFGYFIVLNEVMTIPGTQSHISVTRRPGSNELVLTGTMGQDAPAVEQDLGVDDPALFAALAFKFALQNRGISVQGDARAAHSRVTETANASSARCASGAPSTELACLTSPPLWQVIQVINKVSQNLHAEILLREIGFVARGAGTLAAGLDERDTFLQQAGISREEFSLADGSGLARQNLTSPASTVTLLRYMWTRPERDIWLSSLPIGGVDGSLRQRFRISTGGERVHAKTGSLAHVSTLSGYLQRRDGRWIVFSLMANDEADDGSTEVRDYFDHVCELFLNE